MQTSSPARVVETHISVLFFVGGKVYKLRKPVQFGFLDFRTRADRQIDCAREVVLNRRLAPDVYLGVADLTMGGEAVDHMVVMRELPDERMLANLARGGDDLTSWIKAVAEKLATFHSTADRSPEIDSAASPESLRQAWDENVTEMAPYVGPLIDGHIESEIHVLVSRWLAGRERLLKSRIDSGSVCDGHGDLQAADIFCLDEGVQILDCIEFSDRLRHCDVGYDVAFLAMDLERLGRTQDAERLLLGYEAASGNSLPRSLTFHYGALHAYVRAKVACLRSDQVGYGARAEALEFHHIALAYLRRARVRMILIGGPPGSGKSTIGEGISTAQGWTLLRSDQIRLELGLDEVHAGSGSYDASGRATVYEEMLDRAERLLGLGESVVLDASWIDADRRDDARALAGLTSSDIYEIRCDVTPHEAVARVSRRLSEHADSSEATPEVAVAMRRSMDPWEQAVVLDTSGKTAEEGIFLALAVLPE